MFMKGMSQDAASFHLLFTAAVYARSQHFHLTPPPFLLLPQQGSTQTFPLRRQVAPRLFSTHPCPLWRSSLQPMLLLQLLLAARVQRAAQKVAAGQPLLLLVQGRSLGQMMARMVGADCIIGTGRHRAWWKRYKEACTKWYN